MTSAGRFAVLLGFACGNFPAVAQDAAKPSPALAVLAFEVGDKDVRGELLADLLTVRLADRFTVVERKGLAKVLAEQELNVRGLVNADEAVRIGKLTGAKFLLSGRVLYLGANTLISARLMGVESSRIRGVSLPCKGELSLEEVVDRLAAELSTNIARWQDDLSRQQPGSGEAAPESLLHDGPPVAVLNFANLGQGDPRWDWLGKGLADLTIGNLASQGLHVVSREQMQQMVRELELKKSKNDPKSVARVLRASFSVTGQYQIQAGKLSLHATIAEVATGKPLHNVVVAGAQDDLLKLQKKLSAEVIDVLKGNRPGTLDAAKLPQWTESLTATQLLYQGIEAFDRGQYLDAWGIFRRSLQQDAAYADARYWAGRMMYYADEHHHARVDLERFVVEYPRHPRVGDAIMEIINSVQLTARSPQDVLDILTFGSQLAPTAEVHNQFGVGHSSVVALYSAGMAAQILVDQGRYREAFDRYFEALGHIPHKHPLYWIGWHELFALRLKRLEVTGELLPMPPAPRIEDLLPKKTKSVESDDHTELRSLATRMHPSFKAKWMPLTPRGNYRLPALEPAKLEFVHLTPESPTSALDFSQEPVVPYIFTDHRKDFPSEGLSYPRFLHTDPSQYLTGLDHEVRYRHDPQAQYEIGIEGGGHVQFKPMDESGVFRASVGLAWRRQPGDKGNQQYFHDVAPRSRMLSPHIVIRHRGPVKVTSTTAAVLSWKVTGFFTPSKGVPGTLILHAPRNLGVNVGLDDRPVVFESGHARYEDIPPGPHKLRCSPAEFNRQHAELALEVRPGEVIDIGLFSNLDPGRAATAVNWRLRTINSPYEIFRMGARLGDDAGMRSSDLRFFEDLAGHWIVIWRMGHDLYLVKSADRGSTWSATRKLPPPVNSAHDESLPVLSQDSQGRYLLAFVSDRNLSRFHAMYVCWSEDLVNFSAPVMVSSKPGDPLRLLQHTDGSYRLYFYAVQGLLNRAARDGANNHSVQSNDAWAVCSSSDLVQWSAPVTVTRPSAHMDVIESGGRYFFLTTAPFGLRAKGQLWSCSSDEGLSLSMLKEVPFTYSQTVRDGGKDVPIRFQPAKVVLEKTAGQLLALAGGYSGLGTVFAHQTNDEWKQIGDAAPIPSNVAADGGDYHLGLAGVHYFALARTASIQRNSVLGFGSLRQVSAHQPVHMFRQDFAWLKAMPKEAPARPPVFQLRVLKRHTPAAGAAAPAP